MRTAEWNLRAGRAYVQPISWLAPLATFTAPIGKRASPYPKKKRGAERTRARTPPRAHLLRGERPREPFLRVEAAQAPAVARSPLALVLAEAREPVRVLQGAA